MTALKMRYLLGSLLSLFLMFSQDALAEQLNNCILLPQAHPGYRYLAVISDLHLGLGHSGDRWNPKEDARWPNALDGFLQRISECGKNQVDLVIAGDALELWQPPAEVVCKGLNAEAGCTAAELLTVTTHVLREHKREMQSLGAFADVGANRLYVIPGNHDAALMLPAPWAAFLNALDSKSKRISRVDSGLWISESGKVVIEHGHQIGSDVNGYKGWPDIVANKENGVEYIERPWGERFVQRIFNAEEEHYQIIDNLSPESAGVRYRMEDVGLWQSALDVARFIQFNIFETSSSQKISFAGAPDSAGAAVWNIPLARAKGSELFSNALPDEDPFRKVLVGDSPQAVATRAELTKLAADPIALTDAEVILLCDELKDHEDIRKRCQVPVAGAALQRVFSSKRAVMAKHLLSRIKQYGLSDLQMFIYGHTHLLEELWVSDIGGGNEVAILNTGAFQRVIDEQEFLRLAKAKSMTVAQALRDLTVEDLGPCYTAVVVSQEEFAPQARTVRWRMEEQGTGVFVLPGSKLCQPIAIQAE